MFALASRLCFVAAIGLLVLGIIQLTPSGNPTPSQMALVIEELQQDLGERTIGAYTVTFRVRNTTDRPQQIIGMAEA